VPPPRVRGLSPAAGADMVRPVSPGVLSDRGGPGAAPLCRHFAFLPALCRAFVIAGCALPAPIAPLAPALALQPESADPFEGAVIGEVRFERVVASRGGERRIEPLDERSAAFARNQIRSAPGREFRREVVSSDLVTLSRTGRYRSIEPRVAPRGDGSVVLTYRVQEQPIIADVQVAGNRRISDQAIAKVVDDLVGTPVDAALIERNAESIRKLYRDRGFSNVGVRVDRDELEENGIVLFVISERQAVRVTDVRFEGIGAALSFSPRELRTAIRTRVAGVFETGPLDDDLLADDVVALARFYEDHGYLDVRVDRHVTPSPDGKEAIVTFLIAEGPLYTLRSVRLFYPERARYVGTMSEAQAERADGEEVLRVGPPGTSQSVAVYPMGVFTPEQAMGLMQVKPGDVVNVRKMNRSIQILREAYERLGYVQEAAGLRITDHYLRDERLPLVDLLLEIREGERYRTGEIVIGGNQYTKDSVIRERLPFRPDRPLDGTALRIGEQRLRGAGARPLFDVSRERGGPAVTVVSPEAARAAGAVVEPGYRDVHVEVQETNTSEFLFGAAFSSDQGLLGSVTVRQWNFDVADWPDTAGEFLTNRAFRGAGQVFTLQLQPGTEAQYYDVSLADPTLLGTRHAGEIGTYLRTRQFDIYDETRFGAVGGITRRFGRRWSGGLSLRAESVDLSDIDPAAPTDYFDAAGPDTITSAGLSLSRTNIPEAQGFQPWRGSRADVGVQQFGALAGDWDFTKLTFSHVTYLPLYESALGRKTVLSLTTRVGYIPQDPDAVPVYERFYLGGSSFRGFGFREVSPVGVRNDTGGPSDESVGGTFSFFFGPEIRQPVWRDIISVVGFLDTGTVNKGFGFENYRVSAGAGLRIGIPGVLVIPIAIDFAVPIIKEDTDDERLITFSIDVPFR
jgi:outer membrane protein insertion porin family